MLGVAPVSVCTVVQENSAGQGSEVRVSACESTALSPSLAPGILRNLAFEKAAFRKEIVAFGGVEALLKVRLSLLFLLFLLVLAHPTVCVWPVLPELRRWRSRAGHRGPPQHGRQRGAQVGDGRERGSGHTVRSVFPAATDGGFFQSVRNSLSLSQRSC